MSGGTSPDSAFASVILTPAASGGPALFCERTFIYAAFVMGTGRGQVGDALPAIAEEVAVFIAEGSDAQV